MKVKTWTAKEINKVLKACMDSEKGEHISELDRAYKRGWRDCVRELRKHFKGEEGPVITGLTGQEANPPPLRRRK